MGCIFMCLIKVSVIVTLPVMSHKGDTPTPDTWHKQKAKKKSQAQDDLVRSSQV